MAEEKENSDRDDLSDEPSSYRLEEFRRKGKVSQSRELSGLIGLFGAMAAVYAMTPSIGEDVSAYMREVFDAGYTARINFGDGATLNVTLMRALKLLAMLGLPIAAVGFVMSFFGSFAQIGSIFSTEPLSPDIDRINPIKGFQRLFSLKQVWEAFRLILKAGAMAGAAYLVMKSEIFDSPRFLLTDPSAMLFGFGRSSKSVFFALTIVLAVFAGVDFWLQKSEYLKSLKLTKQEAKQEQKEHEGDPQIKARVRSIQREVARRRMMAAVKTADVVITNPTHIAVAIKYESGKMAAPKVVAKGADFVAQKIKKLAADSGIPLVENVPLARTLYKTVKIGQFIPRALYQAVAEVLAFVYKLKNKKVT